MSKNVGGALPEMGASRSRSDNHPEIQPEKIKISSVSSTNSTTTTTIAGEQIQHELLKSDSSNSPKRSRLLTIFEVPPFLRFNKFIVTGYRHPAPAITALQNLIASIQYWHNESINIWSHLLGLLLFSFIIFHEIYLREEYTRWNVIGTLGGCVIALCGSVMYHSGMNQCQCQREYSKCLNFDVTGVICSISSTALSPIFVGYKCNYTVAVVVALMILVYLTWNALSAVINETATAKVRGKHIGTLAIVRTALVVVMVAGNVLFHARYQNMKYHLLSLALLVMGGVINVTRIPERFIKAETVHFIGNSHQIWHFIVIIVCLMATWGAVWDAYYIQMTEC